MLQPLSELQLTLLRRSAAAGRVRAVTTEEREALDQLVKERFIRDGKLTEEGWSELRKTDRDPWRG
jgi:hypothetical protein